MILGKLCYSDWLSLFISNIEVKEGRVWKEFMLRKGFVRLAMGIQRLFINGKWSSSVSIDICILMDDAIGTIMAKAITSTHRIAKRSSHSFVHSVEP